MWTDVITFTMIIIGLATIVNVVLLIIKIILDKFNIL